MQTPAPPAFVDQDFVRHLEVLTVGRKWVTVMRLPSGYRARLELDDVTSTFRPGDLVAARCAHQAGSAPAVFRVLEVRRVGVVDDLSRWQWEDRLDGAVARASDAGTAVFVTTAEVDPATLQPESLVLGDGLVTGQVRDVTLRNGSSRRVVVGEPAGSWRGHDLARFAYCRGR